MASNDLLTSVVSEVKSYSGNDPLLPWLRGIKKLKESLPPNILKEKLPRFLQRCTQTFVTDRRYRNDLRYLRVWLQLMDYVDNPRELLRTMEVNLIGKKRSLFYQAYALYYEKMKKFDEADKIYHLAVKNLAEPADELQKSYEQFLHRWKRHQEKMIQLLHRQNGKRLLVARKIKNGESTDNRPKRIVDGNSQHFTRTLEESNHVRLPEISSKVGIGSDALAEREHFEGIKHKDICTQQMTEGALNEPRCPGEDTVVVKFVDTAIVGNREAENSCHNGLVEPTVNMKEALNAINNMFRQPLETVPIRKSQREKVKDQNVVEGFSVFVDENVDNKIKPSHGKEDKIPPAFPLGRVQPSQPHQESFQIFIDDVENMENADRTDENDNLENDEDQHMMEAIGSSEYAFVFPCPKDHLSKPSDHTNMKLSSQVKLTEDTVVHRFVGSTILDEPLAENVCHHGLVDPTVNLKEAMEDINGMFGKPIDFVRKRRPKKQATTTTKKEDLGGFSILPDDDFQQQKDPSPPKSSAVSNSDLFEPTTFTKEALDDINKMFGMPLDF